MCALPLESGSSLLLLQDPLQLRKELVDKLKERCWEGLHSAIKAQRWPEKDPPVSFLTAEEEQAPPGMEEMKSPAGL